MISPSPLRVLVVDDTALYRRAVRDALAALPEIQVVGTAGNGKLALAQIAELKPDLITLDMEMPELDGLGVLAALTRIPKPPGVIVLSAHTAAGSALTIQALVAGAFDFLRKPESLSAADSLAELRQELDLRLKTFRSRCAAATVTPHAVPAVLSPVPLPAFRPRPAQRLRLALIGVSTGGPQALMEVLPGLGTDFPLPLLIVQHMPPLFTRALASSLGRRTSLTVKEAEPDEIAVPGSIYIAPGGMQLKVRTSPVGAIQLVITDDPPENHCKPSVDTLFRSVALQLPGAAMAAILTGMGNDGAEGIRLLKRSGCPILAQDEASSVVYGMPKAALATGCVDEVQPLNALGPAMARLCRQERSG